jgi:membrane protease YdiL (CAAX protease family)
MFTDSEGRLQPAWAFLLSAALSCAAFAVSGIFASALTGDHVLRFEVVFRSCLVAILLAGFSWLLTVGNHIETHRLAAQGFPLAAGWSAQFAIGCAIAFVLVSLAASAIAVLGHISFRLTFGPRSLSRIFVILFVLLVGALAEELMFRGYPFQRLVEAIGAGPAILVFSVLFGLIHVLNPGASRFGLFNTVLIGVALSFAYLRTRALWLPWGFHFAWNATMGILLGLPVSGLRMFNSVVHATAIGPSWLTGQTYGPEASLPGALVVVVALLVFWKAPFHQRASPQESPATDITEPPPSDVNAKSHPPSGLGL